MVKFNELPLGKLIRSKKGSNRCFHTYEHGEVLQSYNTIVAARCNGEIYFTRWHDCSPTTKKQVTDWSGISTTARREGLESGVYTLLDAK